MFCLCVCGLECQCEVVWEWVDGRKLMMVYMLMLATGRWEYVFVVNGLGLALLPSMSRRVTWYWDFFVLETFWNLESWQREERIAILDFDSHCEIGIFASLAPRGKVILRTLWSRMFWWRIKRCTSTSWRYEKMTSSCQHTLLEWGIPAVSALEMYLAGVSSSLYSLVVTVSEDVDSSWDEQQGIFKDQRESTFFGGMPYLPS